MTFVFSLHRNHGRWALISRRQFVLTGWFVTIGFYMEGYHDLATAIYEAGMEAQCKIATGLS